MPGLRLLLDQGLPRDAAELLRASGVDCTHVGEIGLWRSEDIEILEWGRAHNSVVVTLDADFHTIMAVTKATSPSVIRLRLQGLKGPAVAALIEKMLSSFASELLAGCLITVKLRKTTCHLLPTTGPNEVGAP